MKLFYSIIFSSYITQKIYFIIKNYIDNYWFHKKGDKEFTSIQINNGLMDNKIYGTRKEIREFLKKIETGNGWKYF